MSCNRPMKSAAFGNFACGDMIQGGVRLCEDCLRNHRANAEFLGQSKPVEKRDFDNLDTRLYLALKAVMNPLLNAAEGVKAEEQAVAVMKDFEDSHGPLPEWAIGRNFGLELVEGAQLFTKDGRHTGNGWIVLVTIPPSETCEVYYHILTDAGNPMRLNERELESLFNVGDWICTRERILTRFDHDGHYKS